MAARRRRNHRDTAEQAALRERIALGLLGTVVVGGALALGSIHSEVLAIVAVAATAAAMLVAPKLDQLRLPASARLILFVIVGLTAWSALQLVPLPLGLLRLIASENADVWSRCLSPLQEDGPAFAPISVDPSATRVQVLRGLTYLAVFAATLPFAKRREQRSLLERIVICSSGTMAVAAVAHPALSIHRIFLVYEPKETYAYEAAHIAPLLNTNHLAAYVNIGVLLALASLFQRGEQRLLPRPVAAVVVVLLGAMTVWTGSRGGFASLVLGSVLITALSLRRKHRGKTSLAAALGVIGSAALFLLSAFDVTRDKLASGNLSKLALAKKSLGLLLDYGIFGAGRGTFETVFPKIREGNEYLVFTHPENFVAQWSTEWGVPVALAAIIALGWALRPQRALFGEHPPIGPWAVIVTVALHNVVDFNGEIPGVVIALTVCTAIVTGREASEIDEFEPATQRRSRVLRIAAASVTGSLATIAWLTADRELHDDERALAASALDRALPREQFRSRARAALLRHPAEPYLPFVGAVRAAATREESVFPWASRALERSPVHGRAHLLLGRALQPRNRSQARLEYRLACTQDSLACIFPETAAIVDSFDDALELVPEGDRGALILESLVNTLPPRLPATAARLERELRKRSPSALSPVRRAAQSAVSDLANGESWCSLELRQACINEGAEAAQHLITTYPQLCDGHELAAIFRREGGDLNGAFEEFDAAVPLVDESSACARRFLDFARATKTKHYIDRALTRLENLTCKGPEDCAWNQILAARAESERGNPARSLVLLQKAWDLNENDLVLEEIGTTAEARGLNAQAIDAYTKLAARHPQEPKWRACLDRARVAGAAQRFQPPPIPSF